jgi:hypothetical protein
MFICGQYILVHRALLKLRVHIVILNCFYNIANKVPYQKLDRQNLDRQNLDRQNLDRHNLDRQNMDTNYSKWTKVFAPPPLKFP